MHLTTSATQGVGTGWGGGVNTGPPAVLANHSLEEKARPKDFDF